MPEEPARRGLDKPALKKPRRSTQALGLRNKRWAGEEAKAAQERSALPRTLKHGQL